MKDSTLTFLNFFLGDLENLKVTDNKITLGRGNNILNLVYSCSPNPSDHLLMFRELVSERKPIVWVKDNLSDQLFRNADLKEFLPNFHNLITILSPYPDRERDNIELYDLPKDLFKIRLFDTDKIRKALYPQDGRIPTAEEKKISEASIDNLLTSLLHQDEFNYTNFLVETSYE